MLSFLTVFHWHSFQQARGNFFLDSRGLLGGKLWNWLTFGEWFGVAVTEIWRQKRATKTLEKRHCEGSWALRVFQKPRAFHGEGLISVKCVAAAGFHSGLSYPTKVSCLGGNSQACEYERKDLLLSHPILGHLWGPCRALGCQRHVGHTAAHMAPGWEQWKQDHQSLTPISFSSFLWFLFYFFYCCSSTVVSIFLPTHSPAPPTPISHTQSYPCCGFVHGSFTHVPWRPFLFFPPLSPPPSPLVTVSLVPISVSLVVFCLLICLVD